MSPRAGLSPAAVVDAALGLADEQGAAAVTLAAVAARAGVATPSLYKHVGGLADLQRLIALRVLGELTAELRRAATGRAGDDAVREVMLAYRRYAVGHPGRYGLIPQVPSWDDPAVEAQGAELVQVVLDVLRGYELGGDAAIHATRCLRASLHGFASLETAGGFGLPQRLDESFGTLIAITVAGLRAAAPAAARE
jgi:AcrR family transcriptional regulator